MCHMCAANKTYRRDSRTLWQHHVAMALPLLFLCVVYVLAFKKAYGFKYASCLVHYMCLTCVWGSQAEQSCTSVHYREVVVEAVRQNT